MGLLIWNKGDGKKRGTLLTNCTNENMLGDKATKTEKSEVTMPRTARLDTPGTLHHVMARGIERRRIVDDDYDRTAFVNRLGQLATDTQTLIYAWALMPNHAHMLLRSGPSGLSTFMRKLLTGYAIRYNRRHERCGHLFQNRYRSIVVEEDAYFRELVRYIHLNPLRAGLVDSLDTLTRYQWCGHSVVVGQKSNSWQDRDYVLRWFGATEGKAVGDYCRFVQDGISLGKQSHLTGGGLVRSTGGWSQVKALRMIGEKDATDERILGSGKFVEQITREADPDKKYRFTSMERRQKVQDLIVDSCHANDISIEALRGGSRRRAVSRVRSELCLKLVDEYGLSLAETARRLGVSTSAIARVLSRNRKNKYN